MAAATGMTCQEGPETKNFTVYLSWPRFHLEFTSTTKNSGKPHQSPSIPAAEGIHRQGKLRKFIFASESLSFKYSICTDQCISKEKENCPTAREDHGQSQLVNTRPLHFIYLFFLFNSFFFFL